MKSILISVHPKWVEKIASRKKTIEIRKSAPKCEVPFKAYIYCTKDKYEWLYQVDNNGYGKTQSWHGKVIGEFVCDKVDEYTFSHYEAEYRVTHVEQNAMCLNQPELIHYGKGKPLYGWLISDLKIYDKPKDIWEFLNYNKHRKCLKCGSFNDKCWICPNNAIIVRPPQSWQYIEEM